MNAAELREILASVPDDTLVVLSRDAEGNGYSKCWGYATNMVYEDGEVGFAALTPELEAKGYGEGDIRTGEPCVVLWP
jgi:hypothetical protein